MASLSTEFTFGETHTMKHLVQLLDSASAFLVALAILAVVLESRR